MLLVISKGDDNYLLCYSDQRKVIINGTLISSLSHTCCTPLSEYIEQVTLETELQSEASTSSMCLNLTEDEVLPQFFLLWIGKSIHSLQGWHTDKEEKGQPSTWTM